MSQNCFHASIEGAQHGGKSLEELITFARQSGGAGCQPSNFHLNEGDGLRSAASIRGAFEGQEMLLDGVSAHCPFWVHTTAWTQSKTIRPFLPPELHSGSVSEVEGWCEDYLLRLMDLCAELGVKILPMFWGLAWGWEVATGYPWGFWSGTDYDLLKEGHERFAKKTARLRDHARGLGLYLCHEIHPNTGAMCAADFQALVAACDGDPCLGVTADPSHCWEHESFETRFRAVADRVYAVHVKNFNVRPGLALRSMNPRWQDRAMQFVDLGSGDLNLTRYAELLIDIGYPGRYCGVMGTRTAPLCAEAESAYRDLDATSANGIQHVRDALCFPVAEGSFEDGMGA